MTQALNLTVSPDFAWLTGPDRRTRITTVADSRLNVDHDPAFHDAIAHDPRRFCAPAVVVTELHLTGDDAELHWAVVPFCRKTTVAGQPIGWNLCVTVDDGNRIVVARRHPSLSDGGRWHVSANESAHPDDLPVGSSSLHDPETVEAICRRALKEELGMRVDTLPLAEAVTVDGLFRIGNGLGVLFTIQGEMLGWTADQVVDAHANASDGWEGQPRVIDRNVTAVAALADGDGWTSWGLPCVLAVTR